MTNFTGRQLDDLFDYYAQHGCPCRFPRFRAIVSLDLNDVGAKNWALSDAHLLLQYLDQRVQLVEVTRGGFMTNGRCAACHSQVVRYCIPLFRDSGLERATITPDAMPDLGAPATLVIPVVGAVFHAEPGYVQPGEVARIQASFPRLTPEAWLEYMRALARE